MVRLTRPGTASPRAARPARPANPSRTRPPGDRSQALLWGLWTHAPHPRAGFVRLVAGLPVAKGGRS